MLDCPASATIATCAARAIQPSSCASRKPAISQRSSVMSPCAMALSSASLMMYGPDSDVAVMTPISSRAMTICRA